MIEIQHLHKRFGDVTAVNGLSFTAPDATITGVLGATGAGKTTTLGMITGLLAPDSGTVSIDRTASNGRDCRSAIGALLDHQGLYPRLTARENIAYFDELQDLSGPALGRRGTELVSALGLDGLADRRVEGFSRGERLKMGITPIIGQQVMITGSMAGDGVSLLRGLPLVSTTAACTIALLLAGSAGLNQDDVLAD
jgi:sodium transport system ATP-binding protein